MGELSDLELVAQAMNPPTQALPPPAEAAPNGTTLTNTTPSSHPSSSAPQAEQPQKSPLAGMDIDLSALTPEDRRALQPILDALAASNLDNVDAGDVDVDGILRQMDAADKVADDLEGKLDGLLAKLEQDAREMERERAVETGASPAAMEQARPARDDKA